MFWQLTSHQSSCGRLLFIGLFALCRETQADFIALPRPTEFIDISGENYIVPNEIHPYEALPILQRAPKEGVYVAVGSERGYMGALLANSDKLLLVDFDSKIIRFNDINVALLRLARDRADYLFLRNEASAEQWAERAKVSGSEDLVHVFKKENWSFWQGNVRDRFAQFNTAPSKKSPGPFFGANYLHSDELFDRISRMAKTGNIQVGFVDLSNPNSYGQLVRALDRSKLKISVLDVSNAWKWFSNKMPEVVEEFRKVTIPESVLLVTRPALRTRPEYFEKAPEHVKDIRHFGWDYIGHTFGRLKNEETTGSIFRALRGEYDRVNASDWEGQRPLNQFLDGIKVDVIAYPTTKSKCGTLFGVIGAFIRKK